MKVQFFITFNNYLASFYHGYTPLGVDPNLHQVKAFSTYGDKCYLPW
jgi:hypothetical protein